MEFQGPNYKEERLRHITSDYNVAERLAREYHMVLSRPREDHLQLRHVEVGWLLDIYPTKKRIYQLPSRRPKCPFLELPQNWTILDVVKAAGGRAR